MVPTEKMSAVSGKVLLVFVIQVQDDYDAATDYIVPRLFLSGDIVGTFDKLVIANGNYDFADGEYTLVCEEACVNAEFAVEKNWKPSSAQ